MAQYSIHYEVTRDTVTPHTPQNGGRYGDKEQTVLTFHPTFSDAADYQYRLEITDGAGGYDVTALFPLKNGVVSFTIPASWTIPGVATLHLVAVETDDNNCETERFHSAPAYLYFENRDNGDILWEATDSAWQAVMMQAVRTAQNASAVATEASTLSQKSANSATAAQIAATQAAIHSEEAVESAAAAAAQSEQAATAAATAATAAQAAEPYAHRAEEAAVSACEDAETCDALLRRCEELCGTVDDIAALAGEDSGVAFPCVTVDTALAADSANPVANAAVTAAVNKLTAATENTAEALNGKAGVSHLHDTDAVRCRNSGYWWGTSDTAEDALMGISRSLASLHSGLDGVSGSLAAERISTAQQGGTVEESLAGLWATKVSTSSLTAETVPFAYSGAPSVSTVADALKLLFGQVGL